MKYPLRIINPFDARMAKAPKSVADATGKIIFTVSDDIEALTLAYKMVIRANRYWRWFGRGDETKAA